MIGSLIALAVIGAVIIGVMMYSRSRGKSESPDNERLFAEASKRGLNYVPYAIPGHLMTMGPFDPSLGATCSNVIWGEVNDWQAVSFVYSWQEQDDRRQRVRHVVVSGVFIGGDLPDMGLEPEIAMTYGKDDLQLESDEFNRAYRVWWTDKESAIAVVDAAMMQFMLANRGSWYLQHGWLYTDQVIVSMKQYESAAGQGISYLTRVAGHLPAWVTRGAQITFTSTDVNAQVGKFFAGW